ncbi:MAG TPA: MFS transporter [Bryobacteraceae bacterium]|nr:MFS transporter [Bryobacteraceae bacterium]
MSRRRWWITGTLCLSTILNYINRQTFSVLAPELVKTFHFSHSDLSSIFGAFQLSYALTWLVGGVALDITGTRLGLAVAVVWWSLVSMATGLANSVRSFAALRFLLGIGEGLNWPGASKAVAEWFPPQERGVAVAIFDSGSSIGGAVAAIVIPWITIRFGWQFAFLVSGALGFAWLGLWLLVYPKRPRSQASVQRQTTAEQISTLWRLMGQGKTWGVVIGRSLTDPVWWFFVFWLPQYLSDARGFSLKQIAMFAWMPFVAADIGNFVGGGISGWLIRRGVPVLKARILVCVYSCIPMLAGIPAASVNTPAAALTLICIALLGYASWSTMGLTFPSDLFPPEVVATVTGLSGFGAGIVSTVFTILIGHIVDRFSYVPAFIAAGTLPILATLAILVLFRKAGKELEHAA